MTPSVQIPSESGPPTSPTPSRRALLAGALGALGATAASAIGRPRTARAADPNDVLLGGANLATSTTTLQINLNNETVLSGLSLLAGIGVRGQSGSSIGVLGTSNSSNGVHGQNAASNQSASLGWSQGNSTGVQGYSGLAPLPAAKAKTGVYGYAAQDIFSSGVSGESPAGVGVRGHTTTGYAGYFEGRVYTNAFYELGEVATPAAPLANRARLFVRDNGAGKTQLCVRFRTGGVQIIKTEL